MTLVIYDIENIKKASGSQREANSDRSNFKFDFLKLKNTIEEEFPGIMYSHCAFMALKDGGEEKFANALRYAGYYVATKRARLKTAKFEGRKYKFYDNDMDAHIVSFLERFSDNYDNIVIVSGDGDLENVLGHVRDKGKFVFVVGWMDNMSGKLKKFPHLFLDEWKDKIEKDKKQGE